MDEKYNDQIDKSLNILSREISNEVTAEIEYKNWKLSLIVSKH